MQHVVLSDCTTRAAGGVRRTNTDSPVPVNSASPSASQGPTSLTNVVVCLLDADDEARVKSTAVSNLQLCANSSSCTILS